MRSGLGHRVDSRLEYSVRLGLELMVRLGYVRALGGVCVRT